MAPLQTFFDAVPDADDAEELASFDILLTLFDALLNAEDDKELASPPLALFDALFDAEDAPVLREEEALEAAEPAELDMLEALETALLLLEESDGLATLDKLNVELCTSSTGIASDTAEAAEYILLEAFSTTPGSVPITEEEIFAAILLALLLATDAMLSILPCEVPITELDAMSAMLLAEA
jgi:hypothetical protein